MRVIAGSCPAGDCPKIFDLETGEVAVQGYDASVAVPSGGSLVRSPAYRILQAADELRQCPPMTLDFNGCFDRFRATAFRLETFQRYTIAEDEPAIAA